MTGRVPHEGDTYEVRDCIVNGLPLLAEVIVAEGNGHRARWTQVKYNVLPGLHWIKTETLFNETCWKPVSTHADLAKRQAEKFQKPPTISEAMARVTTDVSAAMKRMQEATKKRYDEETVRRFLALPAAVRADVHRKSTVDKNRCTCGHDRRFHSKVKGREKLGKCLHLQPIDAATTQMCGCIAFKATTNES